MDKPELKDYAVLHLIFLLYSLGGIASKAAASTQFLSIYFLSLYATILLVLLVYAIFWQQILKKMPLTTAYLNKSVVVIWGMLWGSVLYGEPIKITMIIGSAIIFAGVYLMVSDYE